ncbi:MAG: hypothetical protein DHS80DRAFT_22056 [Piptocephalis tieghemiana]|nr:MAG: hypothetical protein DHS80DRAFT_22056 [Piptocephalis tieghemiana]
MLHSARCSISLFLVALALVSPMTEAQAPPPASSPAPAANAQAPASAPANVPSFPPTTSCMDVIRGIPDLSSFYTLLTKSAQASLVQQVQSGSGQFTIFAPTNSAMRSVSFPAPLPYMRNGTLYTPPASKVNQRELALAAYHILPFSLPTARFPRENTPVGTMMQDANFGLFSNQTASLPSPVLLQATPTNQFVIGHGTGRSAVVKADIQCRTGVIHMINAPFRLPLPASQMLNRTQLTATLGIAQAANKVEKVDRTVGGSVNIFAFPNNSPGAPTQPDAKYFNVTYRPTGWPLFTSSIRAYLAKEGKDEVVASDDDPSIPELLISQAQNGSIFVNGVPIVTPDIPIANGVLHIMAHAMDPNPSSSKNGTSQGSIPSSTVSSPTTQPILLASMTLLAGWMAL